MPDSVVRPSVSPGASRKITRRIRHDQASRDADGAPGPGQGSLLGTFGVWVNAATSGERRGSERRPAVESSATLGWRTWVRQRRVHALIVDISRGGARVFLDAVPPADRVVQLHLVTPGHAVTVEARVLEVHRIAQGQCVARLAFRQPCPYDVFEAAVCGVAPARRPLRRPTTGPSGGTPPSPAGPTA